MIECVALTKKFDHRSVAGVKDLSFAVSKGEVLAILGPNGSGKSTLLNLIQGTLAPDSGTLKTQGLVKKFVPEWKENENVQKFLLNSIELKVSEEKKIQLTRDLASLFEFTFQLKQDLSSLSAGQMQKVLLAKALVNNPDILLFDEPFSHLDPFTRKDILDALFTYLKERSITVLWVTHDLNEAMKYGKRLMLLNHGVKEQIGSAKDLLFLPRNLFVAQFMGHKNFFPMKFENGQWTTPFGPYKSDHQGMKEAYLLIPPQAFVIESDPTGLKITGRVFENLQEYLFIQDREQILKAELPRELAEIPLTHVKLRPVWERCLIVPL